MHFGQVSSSYNTNLRSFSLPTEAKKIFITKRVPLEHGKDYVTSVLHYTNVFLEQMENRKHKKGSMHCLQTTSGLFETIEPQWLAKLLV